MDIGSSYTSFQCKKSKSIKKLDIDFLQMLEDYKVNEWVIPSLIDGNILKKCGYFSSFPNQLTKVGFIKRNCLQNISNNQHDLHCNDFDNTTNTYLTPAACLHIYPEVEQNPIKNEIITTLARVYRYEDGYFKSMERQWDFTVREFVAIGNIKYVKTFLADLELKLLNYALNIFDNVLILESNDFFYPTKQNKLKERYQLNNNLKRELVACIGNEKLAITSFNYHEFHFSKEFNFDNNENIVTGCIGCGLERWLRLLEV